MVTSDLKDAYSFPITGRSWNVLWGQSVLISVSSLRDNIGAAILSRQASSSAGARCYGTIVAEASSVRLPPIAQLLGVLERVRMDGVLLLQNPCSGRAEYSSLTRFLSSTALHGGFPSGGISSHWQRAWSFTPARSCGNCGCGSWGGTTHSLWSINADLWAFYSSANPEKMKCITVSTKILISITVFNIDNNQKCFLSSKSVY